MEWQPSLGAWPVDEETRFPVWAPQAYKIEVVMEGPSCSRADDFDGADLAPLPGGAAVGRVRQGT
ncbi:MAG: hypothetical protein A3I78_01745 [Gammaproteobacteria bacterium RIFCSPLOWO2_02_FULL_56_15]|nr:MAG: hypothetical protein A3I78_01745 [Gammaproteobacteria bacterium RIFCSPLOWO2_02_FULL_56_15]